MGIWRESRTVPQANDLRKARRALDKGERTQEEYDATIAASIAATVAHLGPEHVWINPDCGHKTRGEEEVAGSLANLITVTRIVRDSLANGAAVM